MFSLICLMPDVHIKKHQVFAGSYRKVAVKLNLIESGASSLNSVWGIEVSKCTSCSDSNKLPQCYVREVEAPPADTQAPAGSPERDAFQRNAHNTDPTEQV